MKTPPLWPTPIPGEKLVVKYLPVDTFGAKIAEMEEAMKTGLGQSLYGGPSTRRLTPEQEARAPGYYWTRYPGQEWTLDSWDHGCWSFVGSDEISTADPPEIVGPVEPPPV